MTEQQQPGRELLGPVSGCELASVMVTGHGPALVLTIAGEIDISNIDKVSEVIYALPNPEDGLLINLSAVSYLDSSAVSLLHDLAMRLRGRAQSMIVVSPLETPPRRVLELTALYVNAPIAETLDDGLKLLGDTGLR